MLPLYHSTRRAKLMVRAFALSPNEPALTPPEPVIVPARFAAERLVLGLAQFGWLKTLVEYRSTRRRGTRALSENRKYFSRLACHRFSPGPMTRPREELPKRP